MINPLVELENRYKATNALIVKLESQYESCITKQDYDEAWCIQRLLKEMNDIIVSVLLDINSIEQPLSSQLLSGQISNKAELSSFQPSSQLLSGQKEETLLTASNNPVMTEAEKTFYLNNSHLREEKTSADDFIEEALRDANLEKPQVLWGNQVPLEHYITDSASSVHLS